jgi:predicted nucleotidyltransferase component of viral defense system
MKTYLASIVAGASTPIAGRNLAREYLQAHILASLQRTGAMIPLAFHGGTALRFLYSIPRYSEDLDFALERRGRGYDLQGCLNAVLRDFVNEGYSVEIKINEQRVVHSAFVRFPGLLYELGLSPHRDQVLAVKIEVDTNPPAAAGLETTIVRRHVILHLQHHDKASLLAGKLHAILVRPFMKGRDIYDIFWYLSDPGWPAPNLDLLRNALRQTGWEAELPGEDTWRGMVRQRIETIDWSRVLRDVQPFLETQEQMGLLTPLNLEHLLAPDTQE